MASQYSGPLLRELECGVCLDVLRDPKILDCSHTFCSACLSRLAAAKNQSICCPLCQRATVLPPGGVVALRSNILARSMVDALVTMSPAESVEVGLEATELASVAPRHLPGPPPPGSPVDASSKDASTSCESHPGRSLTLFCVDCKLPLCLCAGKQRPPGHTVTKRGMSVAGEPRSELRALVGRLEARRLPYEQAATLVEEREGDLTAAAARAWEGVTAAAETLIADVRQKQRLLFDQITFVACGRKDAMQELMVGIRGVLQEVGIAAEEMENLEGKNDSAIRALVGRIKQELELMNQNPPPSAIATDGLGFLKFSAETVPSFNLHLGDLVESEEWRLDLKFGRFGSKIGEFNCALGVAISPDGHMAITEQLNHRTCIFDTDGRHRLTMTGKSSGHPDREDRDVAFLSDGRCLVLSKSSNIQVYDRNGGYVNSILNPVQSPWCFAVDAGDTVYLGDSSKSLIYVMKDGVVIRQLPVTHRPIGLAVDNQGRILVSSMVSKRVDLVSTATGEVISTILSTSVDPSNSVSPWGACFAPDGSIFVPFYNARDLNKGTVHEFDPHGRHLSCVARDFQAPRKLGFTRDGRLIVVDGTSIKLFRKA